ncbi:hypothetical protein DC20_08495 [Rufibacter tibetensis]|uniref:Uncharacterized protein n=1 Tax=Rufibacter tibetensis TaxID=512763 RepID=A0A0P0CX80_9BACT|nr:hypothetical protein DC20_08495 [Rufibacter tibetensis]
MLDRDERRIHKAGRISGTTERIFQNAGENVGTRNLIHFCTALMTNKILFKKKSFYNRYQVGSVEKWEKPADRE